MEVGDVWCSGCSRYHPEGDHFGFGPTSRPDLESAAALDEIFEAVREQEVNWDLDNRIRLALSQDEARRLRRDETAADIRRRRIEGGPRP